MTSVVALINDYSIAEGLDLACRSTATSKPKPPISSCIDSRLQIESSAFIIPACILIEKDLLRLLRGGLPEVVEW